MIYTWIEQNLDTYTRRARLKPALIVIFPFVLSVLFFFPNELTLLSILVSLGLFCGGTAVLAQTGRDLGKQKEPDLFSTWEGGKPTTCLLRHRTATNKIMLERQHRKLQSLLPDLKIPSASEEADAPELADETYEACVAFLRSSTRDKEKFSLVFEENCNYGFRRNLWGMKPIGVSTSIFGLLVSVWAIARNYLAGNSISSLSLITGIASLILLSLWLVLFTPSWVKVTADAYARQLVESCENIQ